CPAATRIPNIGLKAWRESASTSTNTTSLTSLTWICFALPDGATIRMHIPGRPPRRGPSMTSPGSVSLWIAQLKAGVPAAAQPLWEHYVRQLVARARRQLARLPRRAADEEDVALSAFASFCHAAKRGCFPDLHDRDDLWQLLVLLTDRKACNLAKHERRKKR